MTRESTDRVDFASEPIGQFYAWWRGDPLPAVAMPRHLTIEPVGESPGDAPIPGMECGEARQRIEAGHRPWIARIGDEIVAWGWVATREAGISELGLWFPLPERERYLWNFVTRPAWRGQGIYPAMLRAILARELDADRFWIGHDLDNAASRSGILKAGFTLVGAVYRMTGGGLAHVPDGPAGRAQAAAALLGLPLVCQPNDAHRPQSSPDRPSRH